MRNVDATALQEKIGRAETRGVVRAVLDSLNRVLPDLQAS